MEVFDKQVHADEFKLRILLTDGCNYNCSFCLNDFQPKPAGDFTFLDVETAKRAIRAYANSFKNKYPLQVYFSGGEPTLHPNLPELIDFAKEHGCRVTLNTNGSFQESLEPKLANVDCMHFGVYSYSIALAQRIKRMKGSVQCVYSKSFPYVTWDFVKYYLSMWLPVKVFGDLKEDPSGYAEFAKELTEKANEYFRPRNFKDGKIPLSFRFIGIQENRGIGCSNCDRYCVTLKGAWVFPNGGVSHCPQKCKGIVYDPEMVFCGMGPASAIETEWMIALQEIERLHRSV